MPKKPSVESADLSLLSVPAFWPMAITTAMFKKDTEFYARNPELLTRRSKFITS